MDVITGTACHSKFQVGQILDWFMVVHSLGSDYRSPVLSQWHSQMLSSSLTLDWVKASRALWIKSSFLLLDCSQSTSVTLHWTFGVSGMLDDLASNCFSNRGHLLGTLMNHSLVELAIWWLSIANQVHKTLVIAQLCWQCAHGKPVMHASVNCETSCLWISLQRSWTL